MLYTNNSNKTLLSHLPKNKNKLSQPIHVCRFPWHWEKQHWNCWCIHRLIEGHFSNKYFLKSALVYNHNYYNVFGLYRHVRVNGVFFFSNELTRHYHHQAVCSPNETETHTLWYALPHNSTVQNWTIHLSNNLEYTVLALGTYSCPPKMRGLLSCKTASQCRVGDNSREKLVPMPPNCFLDALVISFICSSFKLFLLFFMTG